MTRPGDPLDIGRETFEKLIQRVAAHPINEAQSAIANQLHPIGERLNETRRTIQDLGEGIKGLGEEIEKHRRGNVDFQASAHEELTALRFGQDELRSAVQGIGAELAAAQGRLTTTLRRLATLYALLTVILGFVLVMLMTQT